MLIHVLALVLSFPFGFSFIPTLASVTSGEVPQRLETPENLQRIVEYAGAVDRSSIELFGYGVKEFKIKIGVNSLEYRLSRKKGGCFYYSSIREDNFKTSDRDLDSFCELKSESFGDLIVGIAQILAHTSAFLRGREISLTFKRGEDDYYITTTLVDGEDGCFITQGKVVVNSEKSFSIAGFNCE